MLPIPLLPGLTTSDSPRVAKDVLEQVQMGMEMGMEMVMVMAIEIKLWGIGCTAMET